MKESSSMMVVGKEFRKLEEGKPLTREQLESYFADTIDVQVKYITVAEQLARVAKAFEQVSQPVPEKKEEAVDQETSLFLQRREEEALVWYPRNQNFGKSYDQPDGTVMVAPLWHFNVKDLLARFFIETHARLGEIANWRPNCIGITSMYAGRAKGGNQHMPFLDYDGKNVKTQIRKDVKLLQNEYGLGDASIYETRRGFHVYFFTDSVPWAVYSEILSVVHCCRGFRKSAQALGYGILRISAKYTDFDIKFLYVLAAKGGPLRRMLRKAHLIRALLDLGTQCGTHFASMFPQWAHFQQDPKEWKPLIQEAPVKGKRIRKVQEFGAIPVVISINNAELQYNAPQYDQVTVHPIGSKWNLVQQENSVGSTLTISHSAVANGSWYITSTGNGTGNGTG